MSPLVTDIIHFTFKLQSQKVHPLPLKGQFTQKWKFSHHLLTLMSFHNCMIIFLLSKKEFSWIFELLLLHTMKLDRDQVLFMSEKDKEKHFKCQKLSPYNFCSTVHY